ncbi:MAG TPA: hypothetical protein VF211_02150 [Burkholderiales bacterium]
MDGKLRECLPGQELVFVRTMHQAIAALRRDGFRLLVIDLTFDESRMFELLQYARGLKKYRDVPAVCVYGDYLNLSEAVVRSLDVAVKALGGVGFIDLRDGTLDYRVECRRLGAVAAGGSVPPD